MLTASNKAVDKMEVTTSDAVLSRGMSITQKLIWGPSKTAASRDFDLVCIIGPGRRDTTLHVQTRGFWRIVDHTIANFEAFPLRSSSRRLIPIRRLSVPQTSGIPRRQKFFLGHSQFVCRLLHLDVGRRIKAKKDMPFLKISFAFNKCNNLEHSTALSWDCCNNEGRTMCID
ncbi:hypothetical protein BDD12DRAFT_874725 [Trichophaea hybrida]|nr:hypothetical protein BDD12DRAFT_874725 [Trichophaea hybrida]